MSALSFSIEFCISVPAPYRFDLCFDFVFGHAWFNLAKCFCHLAKLKERLASVEVRLSDFNARPVCTIHRTLARSLRFQKPRYRLVVQGIQLAPVLHHIFGKFKRDWHRVHASRSPILLMKLYQAPEPRNSVRVFSICALVAPLRLIIALTPTSPSAL